jgi:hypothetical protein
MDDIRNLTDRDTKKYYDEYVLRRPCIPGVQSIQHKKENILDTLAPFNIHVYW